MGAISNPSRVFPGKRLPGHMGCVRVTVKNLTVVKVDTENNLIAVKGAVPGAKGTIITLATSVKAYGGKMCIRDSHHEGHYGGGKPQGGCHRVLAAGDR